MTADAVTLINPIEVPAGREDEALAMWGRVAAFMRGRPGFLATGLRETVAPGGRFTLVNVAEWTSTDAFLGAATTGEFRELTRGSQGRFPHDPGLYRLARG
jgi:heme-degrading monooxygenase HmoA